MGKNEDIQNQKYTFSFFASAHMPTKFEDHTPLRFGNKISPRLRGFFAPQTHPIPHWHSLVKSVYPTSYSIFVKK